MIGFLISLLIASQIINPLSEFAARLPANSDFSMPKRKMTASFEPIVQAKSAVVVDSVTNEILFEKNSLEPRSIASITKLMTAIVFLEAKHSFDKMVQVTEDDKENGGRAEITPGEIIKTENLFNAALIGSINNAAYELSFATDLSYADFIKNMNNKSKEIGMKNTFFYEPTGISSRNKSTARDLVLLLQYALEKKEIKDALAKQNYYFESLNGQKHFIESTNELLGSYLGSVGGKTGYTDEAGYCFVNMVDGKDGKNRLVTVVLGAKTKEDRFQENKFLTQWVMDNWAWE